MLGRRPIERPLTRSERARMQPRDPKGRFRGYDTVMVVDEFGNVGKDPKRSETKFGFSVSVTERPEDFGRVTEMNRILHKTEWKASDDTQDERVRKTRGIARIGTKTFAYYVDKNHPPAEWLDDDRRKVMRGMLNYTIDSTLPETHGDVLIVVDHHTTYKGRVRPMIESKSTPWRIVEGDEYKSHQGPYSDLLQTHDYVANAARSKIEIGESTRADILRMRVHKIRGGEFHVE